MMGTQSVHIARAFIFYLDAGRAWNSHNFFTWTNFSNFHIKLRSLNERKKIDAYIE